MASLRNPPGQPPAVAGLFIGAAAITSLERAKVEAHCLSGAIPVESLVTQPGMATGPHQYRPGDPMAKLAMLKPSLRTMDTRSTRPPPKVAEPFYSTKEWIELRDRVRREARGMCQVPGCNRRGHIVDHIVEIRDGGAKLDRANLELKCAHHHSLKTAAERAKRMAKRYN